MNVNLTPNSPAGRFEHVLRLYWGKSYKGESLNAAVLDTFYVTTSLLGRTICFRRRGSSRMNPDR